MRTPMRLLSILCVAALCLAGCKKKSWEPFYQLDGQQQVLLARDGEPAYLEPEMDGIITALRAAPPDSREFAQAIALADKLAAEQSRLRKEEEDKRTAAANVVRPPNPQPPANTFAPPPAPAPSVDASVPAEPETPYAGMTEAEFLKAFGKCFTPGPATTGPDGGAATSQLVKSDPGCSKFGPPENETSYVFLVKSGLWGSLTRPPPTIQKVVIPPEPGKYRVATNDAGEPLRVLPGAPVPEGYQRANEIDGGVPGY